VPDAVADGVTGLLVDPGDARAVSAALTSLLSDEALRSRLGAAARERAAARFDWSAVGEQFRAVLAEAW
ncbi:MAG: glycosyltransferase, partial [Gemmatimonadaceae bacterium]|nr:glycosyltransferase [Gemmatimonadaceae bacterium]